MTILVDTTVYEPKHLDGVGRCECCQRKPLVYRRTRDPRYPRGQDQIMLAIVLSETRAEMSARSGGKRSNECLLDYLARRFAHELEQMDELQFDHDAFLAGCGVRPAVSTQKGV